MDDMLLKTGAGRSGIDEFHRARINAARDQLAVIKAKFAGRVPAVESNVVEGDAVASLLNISRKRHIDLMTFGSRGHGPLRQVLLGSVARHLLNEAPCDLFLGANIENPE